MLIFFFIEYFHFSNYIWQTKNVCFNETLELVVFCMNISRKLSIKRVKIQFKNITLSIYIKHLHIKSRNVCYMLVIFQNKFLRKIYTNIAPLHWT